MPKYEVIISWSNEDRVFVAEVPELPGCMAHGETEESALKNIKEAIQLRLAVDAEDRASFEERTCESGLPFEDVVKDLRQRGRI